MSDGTREARAAAQWWADRLADAGETRTGDAMNDAFAMYARSKIPLPTAAQVNEFRAHLEAVLLAWIGDPQRYWRDAVESGGNRLGAAFRTVAVDYRPDPILGDALEAAGLGGAFMTLRLPLKTVMWVNPGRVTVRHGYKDPEGELDLEPE